MQFGRSIWISSFKEFALDRLEITLLVSHGCDNAIKQLYRFHRLKPL